jgi:hypothetical protein
MSAVIYIEQTHGFTVHVDGMLITPDNATEREAITQMQAIRRIYGFE